MKKISCLLLVCMIAFCTLAGCKPTTDRQNEENVEKGDTYTVTDLLGRTVELPATVERVACIGSGALRLYSYIGDLSKLCGVEACEYGYLISVRPYQTVNAKVFQSLPSIGAGGPQGGPDAEALLSADPDVIFSLYTTDLSAMDALQQKTGIPVVVLSYGDTEVFDADVITSVTLMGRILGREARAQEVAAYITGLQADLERRTKDIAEEEKKTVYLGCHSHYGIHGIGSSTAGYALFDVVGAKNILDMHGYAGYQGNLDLETIVTLDPEIIILDAGGLSVLQEEYKEKRDVFETLKAFQTGEVYLQMPYNAYFTNLEIAYANAYFIGKTVYPQAFADIDMAAKFGEISTKLLGTDCYQAVLEAIPTGYQKLNMAWLTA